MDKGGVGVLKIGHFSYTSYVYPPLCCFLFLRQKRVHVNLFFLQKIVYNKIVRSLDYLNRRKVLYVYIDNTVLV